MEQLRKTHPNHANYFEGTVAQWVDAGMQSHLANKHQQFNVGASLRREGDTTHWLGCETAKEAKQILLSASYPRAIDLMVKEHYQLAALPIKRRRLAWDSSGDEIDRNRMYTGERDFWRVAKRQPTLAFPLITLNCTLLQSASRHASELLWRGVAALNFIDVAERSGYRVQVLATGKSRGIYKAQVNGSLDTAMCVIAKEFNQPVNLNALSVVLSFAGFLRATLFDAWRCQPNAMWSTLGFPADLPMNDLHANCFELPNHIRNQASADIWFRDAVEKIAQLNKEARAA